MQSTISLVIGFPVSGTVSVVYIQLIYIN
jgi:hypothetical protein